MILESLEKRFKIVDLNEAVNVAKAIPYNDLIKQKPFMKKSTFMSDFTGDEEVKLEGELDEKLIQA